MNRPTTLDLDMRQALTEALIDFEGGLVARTSHDRHLIRSTTDDLYLVHDGKARSRSTAIWKIISSGSATRKNRSPRAARRQKRGGNSAQARKDQEASGKRSCAARPNRCAKRSPVWKKRWTSSTRSWPVRKKNLATVRLYDASREKPS